MKRLLISNLKKTSKTTVKVHGFVDTIRNQKNMQFIILRDYSGKVQLIHQRKNNAKISAIIDRLTEESTIEVVGSLVKNPSVKLGGIEIAIDEINVSSVAERNLPIAPDSSLDKQIDWRHLSLRHPENQLIFQIQSTMEYAMRDFWDDHKFTEIHTPKLMQTSSESGAELFKVPYFFGKTATLAQSPQFYKQMAMAAGIDRIFEVGPVFRANPSFTSRHDTEFTMIDMEISCIDSHEDVMHMEEQWLRCVLYDTLSLHSKEIQEVFGVETEAPSTPFPRITLAEAREVLAKRGHVIAHKADLDPKGERMLSDYIMEEYGHEFVFVTDYPAEVRPFYHMRNPENPEITKSFDLLWKGLEITTGAQREHRYPQLLKQVKEKGLNVDELESYLNFFRFGCPPHGGCGISISRMLMILLNRENVREVTFLYRGPKRLTP